MKEYHVLFTGVGRRVELIQAFRQAALYLGIDIKLYGADMVESAPALAFCDFTRIVCGMKEAGYIPQLIDICKADHIDMLIPTIDTDLLILSENKERFERIGTRVLISESDKIAVCRDKKYTAIFFESCGLKTPPVVNDYHFFNGPFPCFIKPKDGSSSINAFKAETKTELATYATQIDNYIIQPFISGTEYTIDIFCDYEGNPVFITPRIRLSVRSGEVLKTQISMDERIITECKEIINKFKPCGPITVQMIRENSSSDDYFIEINPRFGGGAPLSMKAGADSAENVLRMLMNEKLEYKAYAAADGAVYSRFDQSVCVADGKRKQPILGVIFDLDDTLYSEKQYVRSGYKSVSEYLGGDYEDKLWEYFERGKSSIDELLKELGCLEKKDKCLEVYREHIPKITLYNGVAELIETLKKNDIKVGIITDGRVSGQKKKISALGLDKLIEDIIITDELGGIQFRKPCDIAFRIMQRRWQLPFEQIIYVGDNLEKDFKATRLLGIKSVCVQNEDGLYKNNVELNKMIMTVDMPINMLSLSTVGSV